MITGVLQDLEPRKTRENIRRKGVSLDHQRHYCYKKWVKITEPYTSSISSSYVNYAPPTAALALVHYSTCRISLPHTRGISDQLIAHYRCSALPVGSGSRWQWSATVFRRRC